MHAWFAVFSTIHSRILLTECASESLYSVQNIAIHRIRYIFHSTNTLVYRLGPNVHVFINGVIALNYVKLTILYAQQSAAKVPRATNNSIAKVT